MRLYHNFYLVSFKSWGPQSYNLKELGSAHNPVSLARTLDLRGDGHHLDYSPWDPEEGTHPSGTQASNLWKLQDHICVFVEVATVIICYIAVDSQHRSLTHWGKSKENYLVQKLLNFYQVPNTIKEYLHLTRVTTCKTVFLQWLRWLVGDPFRQQPSRGRAISSSHTFQGAHLSTRRTMAKYSTTNGRDGYWVF